MYRSKYSTLNHDTDAKGYLRPSCIQRYMQETANRQMRDSKPTYEELFDEGKAFILSRMVVKCHRPIKQYEDIEVETWPSDSDRGVTFTRCYVIYAEGIEVARGLGIWALVDIPTRKLLRTSEMDFTNYEMGSPFEMEGLRFRIPKEEMETVGEYQVTYSVVDCNMHMNNTNYPDMLFSYIPDIDKHYVTDMSITYKAEAPLGAQLRIERSQPQINEDGTTTYYFRTYTEEKVNVEAFMTIR